MIIVHTLRPTVQLDRSDHEFFCVSLCDMGSAWLVHVPIARTRHLNFEDFGVRFVPQGIVVSRVMHLAIAGEWPEMS